MKKLYDTCRMRFCKKAYAIITVCGLWMFGLFLGKFAAVASDAASVALVRSSTTFTPILVFQIIGQLLPLAITFLLVHYRCVKFLYAVISAESFCFAYVAFLCVRAFGSAGWLVYRILLFSECINTFLLLWLWVNVIIDPRSFTLRKFCFISLIMCLLTLFDGLVCSKFLISVLT